MFADEIVFTNMNDSEVTERDKQYYNHGAEDLANALLILMNMKSSEIQDLFLIEANETPIQNLLKSEGYETIIEKIKNYRAKSAEIADKISSLMNEYGSCAVKRIAADMVLRQSDNGEIHYILH